jgi:hypothetical protein
MSCILYMMLPIVYLVWSTGVYKQETESQFLTLKILWAVIRYEP